jgi:DNA-binding MurR/RpiR family transcriptional regulator
LSGRTKDTYDSLQIAKENGATIIAVTNYLSSPIAKLSDIVLQTSIEEFLDGGSLAGIISQLYICNVLVQGYEIYNKIDTIPLREKALRSIIGKAIE